MYHNIIFTLKMRKKQSIKKLGIEIILYKIVKNLNCYDMQYFSYSLIIKFT